MTKLDLQIQVLKTSLGLDEEKVTVLAQAVRSYAVDMLNLAQYLRDKEIEMDTARDIMEGHGISYDGKTKKFK